MPDKVFTTGKAGEYGGLRFKISKVIKTSLVFLVILILSVSFKKTKAIAKPAFIIKIPCVVNFAVIF